MTFILIERKKKNKVSVTKVKKTKEKLLTKSTKDFGIANLRGVELKGLLEYDYFGENIFLRQCSEKAQ